MKSSNWVQLALGLVFLAGVTAMMYGLKRLSDERSYVRVY